ncbi:uncharacterized protein KGF55_001647 [Candida pseudojiufengensis]|uniref:uncharacterized protein n=1 Tax=Candida pseudojiufengensis TaxID=497109 RepID=UPI0022255564|nr:uncharacterized protein KGF55_001647 [Candida pseudojiufengensis]KAI5964578.1 hypothetical protein KGF55_001647 [Candida pseudojiufengensis]
MRFNSETNLNHVNQRHLNSLPYYFTTKLQQNSNNNPNSNIAHFTTNPSLTSIPRFYNKKLKFILPFLIIILCIYKTFTIYLTTELDQQLLENHALNLNKNSNFNPKNIALDLFNYLIELNHSINSSNLGTKDGIFFHWDDWVDLSGANHLINKARIASPSGIYCDHSLIQYGNVNGHWLESYDTKIFRGAVNLYCSYDIPEKVIITTDESLIEIPVIGKRRFGGNDKTIPVKSDQLINKMKILTNKFNNISKDDNKKELTNFNIKSIKNLQKQVMIEPEDFIFKPDIEIFSLQEKLNNQTITSKELKYLEFLEYSNNHLVDFSDRYFKYPWIYSDIFQGNSHHIAYPFFKRYISDRERQSILHHMIRNWFQFAEVNGFASWINHGSLLGWAFNGLNMPWDTDIDIQMPIAQLDRLGRNFNRTLIMENPRYGNARYWLEIAPTYIRQGNGKNFIDARFIDISSGLYIDISALSHTEIPPPIDEKNFKDNLKTMSVHCKNWNWHTLDELLPIRHTFFEGSSVYIPNKVEQPLRNKYGQNALIEYNYHNHNYQSDISLWVNNKICKSPPKNLNNRFNKWNQLTKKGACNSRILQDEFNIIKECVERHHLLNSNLDNFNFYNIEEIGDLPIFRKDSFDYYNDINNQLVFNDDWYIRKEIIKSNQLISDSNENQDSNQEQFYLKQEDQQQEKQHSSINNDHSSSISNVQTSS